MKTLREKTCKTCKTCKQTFTPDRSRQKVCSPKCAKILVNEHTRKAAEKERKRKLAFLATSRDLKPKVERAVNAYVRLRDCGLPCISCGAHIPKGQVDAGHFIAISHCEAMRFDFDNIHGQCQKCNRWKGGNYLQYRQGLLQRYGKHYVFLLEERQRKHQLITKKAFSVQQLISILQNAKIAKNSIQNRGKIGS